MVKTSNVGDVTLATSSGTGLVLAISKYATFVSITLTAIGVMAGVIFHILALKDRRRQLKINEQMLNLKRQEGQSSKRNNIKKGR